jgi:outer membrane protein OmpA-like peptidoglycan-associated protein
VVLPSAETVQPAAPSETVVAEAPAPVALVSPDANGSVVVDNGVVKFYFATGRTDLPAGAVPALQTAIDAAKAGKRLQISGYHDATGSLSRNAAIAKQRAMSVRTALFEAGVAEKSLELRKPAQSVGSGDPAQARRVEVTIID